MLCVWVNAAGDDVDTVKLVDRLTILTTLEIDMVEAVLTVKPLYHTSVNRLNDNNRAVEVCLGIHVPYNPVNKSTEEITLTKLDDSLRCHTLWGSEFVK